MSDRSNRRIVLASRPSGAPVPENFRLETVPLPVPGDGEVLLKILFLSLDPYMRGRMDDAKSYSAPVPVGGVMEGGTVGQVLASNHPKFHPGQFVLSHSGWQEYAVAPGASLRLLDQDTALLSTALGVFGMPGYAGYVGLRVIGNPKPGETLVVAAATGPVGSVVGQIAKLQGLKTVGIAGGPDKVAFARDQLGFDIALDHRAPDFAQQLAAAVPDGIDIYFENVGGHVWDAVFPLLNDFARVPVCGLIAHYNEQGAGEGPDRLVPMMRVLLRSRLRIQGFIQRDYPEYRDDFYREMGGWLREGRIRHREDIVDGLENAPAAFQGLLRGENFGKLVIRVGQPDQPGISEAGGFR